MSNARNLARLLPNASGQLPDAAMSSGSVLQVVQGVLTDPVVYSAQAWGDLGIQAAITPISTTSKILVSVHIAIGGNNSSYDAGISLLRNGTHIGLPTNYGQRMPSILPFNQRESSGYECSTISAQYLDSPNTTSSITYKMQGYSNNGTAQFINRSGADENNFSDSRHISTITLMEIAA